VYAGPGALPAEDIAGWIAAAASALRARGLLFVHERHPAGECVEPMALRWSTDYFERPWRVDTLVEAALGAGLELRRLAELRAPAPTPRKPRTGRLAA